MPLTSEEIAFLGPVVSEYPTSGPDPPGVCWASEG